MKNLLLVLSLLIMVALPGMSSAAECSDSDGVCIGKALVAYNRTVLKANDALFGAMMKIGSKWYVPSAVYGTPISPLADEAWLKATEKFIATHQKAATKLFSKVPTADAILFVGVSYEVLTGADFLFDQAFEIGDFALETFVIFP